eukprot:CAMPEP_0174982670 /NCGR_PEP_ID=MMETSP0004_2-20121128/16651_1 /TAXON_ID=420556 /ORGANISM="Ochromonas sp., Strain CCMP1393" /LENGTH=1037 /DNA_ID=CAMNT_0016234705 /DNA_START=59 /DNA_END=3172 /DNA_ORIENTATION=+
MSQSKASRRIQPSVHAQLMENSYGLDFVKSLTVPKRRLKALDTVANFSDEDVQGLREREVKTIIAACIESEFESLLINFVKQLHGANMITDELMYIAIRLSCRRKLPNVAYQLLQMVKDYGLFIDVDSVNGVIEVMVTSLEIRGALELMSSLSDGGFGPDINCDHSSYELLLESTTRQGDRNLLIQSCRFIAQNKHRIQQTDERMFMEALNVCALRGDLIAAMELFKLYESFHGIVQTRAYALLLTAYVTNKDGRNNDDRNEHYDENDDASYSCGSVSRTATNGMAELDAPGGSEGLDSPNNWLDGVVNFIVQSNIDNNAVIGNLVLRYFCLSNSLDAAYAYLHRLWDRFGTIPSTLALWSFSERVCNANELNSWLATLIHMYCRDMNITPFYNLHACSLLRCESSASQNHSASYSFDLFHIASDHALKALSPTNGGRRWLNSSIVAQSKTEDPLILEERDAYSMFRTLLIENSQLVAVKANEEGDRAVSLALMQDLVHLQENRVITMNSTQLAALMTPVLSVVERNRKGDDDLFFATFTSIILQFLEEWFIQAMTDSSRLQQAMSVPSSPLMPTETASASSSGYSSASDEIMELYSEPLGWYLYVRGSSSSSCRSSSSSSSSSSSRRLRLGVNTSTEHGPVPTSTTTTTTATTTTSTNGSRRGHNSSQVSLHLPATSTTFNNSRKTSSKLRRLLSLNINEVSSSSALLVDDLNSTDSADNAQYAEGLVSLAQMALQSNRSDLYAALRILMSEEELVSECLDSLDIAAKILLPAYSSSDGVDSLLAAATGIDSRTDQLPSEITGKFTPVVSSYARNLLVNVERWLVTVMLYAAAKAPRNALVLCRNALLRLQQQFKNDQLSITPLEVNLLLRGIVMDVLYHRSAGRYEGAGISNTQRDPSQQQLNLVNIDDVYDTLRVMLKHNISLHPLNSQLPVGSDPSSPGVTANNINMRDISNLASVLKNYPSFTGVSSMGELQSSVATMTAETPPPGTPKPASASSGIPSMLDDILGSHIAHTCQVYDARMLITSARRLIDSL